MRTRNEIHVRASLERCFQAASEVERWPDLLPHYRAVSFRRREGPAQGRVHMAAFRHFGPVPYPIWWESEMTTDGESSIRYRHVDGVTKGMEVEWKLAEEGGGTGIVILHEWNGPSWPVLGRLAADRIIGPHFIFVVAQRTLVGIKQALEQDLLETQPGRPARRPD